MTHDHESVNHPGLACRGKLLNPQSTSHLLQSITNKIVLFCALCHRPPMCCVQNCLQVCPFCAWDTSKPFLESDILGLFRSIVHIVESTKLGTQINQIQFAYEHLNWSNINRVQICWLLVPYDLIRLWKIYFTAGLAMDYRVDLRWHFRCGYPISKPRAVLSFSSKNQGSFYLFFQKVKKWARATNNAVFGDFGKKLIVLW